MAAIGIANVGAESCHFDLHPFLNHKNYAEFCTHCKTVRKKLLNVVRARICANVVVCRLAAKHQVAHTAAHEVRLFTIGTQDSADLFGQVTRIHS